MSLTFRSSGLCSSDYRFVFTLVFMCFLVLVLNHSAAGGQVITPVDRERQFEDERLISIMEESEWQMPPADPGVTFDYGGWLTTNCYFFDELDRSSLLPDSVDGACTLDMRFWTRVFFGPKHSFYLRLKHQFNMTDWAGTLSGRSSTDVNGPHLDMAYATLGFPRGASARIGRQYFKLGRGLALGDVLDGVKLKKHFKKSALEIYLACSRPHTNNIDTSVPGYYLGSNRLFAALAGEYRMTAGRRFYGYLLVEEDRSQEIPDDPNQTYDYDAAYLAFGADGEVVKNLSYWSEFVKQWGETPVAGTKATADVSAFAYTLGARWLPPVCMHPTLSFELFSGSGDPERNSVTNTLSGKTTTAVDNAYRHFSAPRLGLAFSPMLSNIRVERLGFSFKPMGGSRLGQELLVSVISSRYRKRKGAGAISDVRASEDSKDIGREIDLYLFWKIWPDLRVIFRHGRFSPGGAYPVAGRTRSLFTSLSCSCSF